jgi:Na+-transporting methylmalonyl-CoA/oxaloacetate decarboxylase beta subunit
MDLIAATLCITYDATLVSPPNTTVTLAAISTLAATSDTSLEITIAITNLYKAQLFLSFGLNTGFLPLLGNPQLTILPDSLST